MLFRARVVSIIKQIKSEFLSAEMLNLNGVKERPEFETYSKIKLLGEGSFGKAFLVKRVKDGSLCVMKMIDIHRMSEKEKRETV